MLNYVQLIGRIGNFPWNSKMQKDEWVPTPGEERPQNALELHRCHSRCQVQKGLTFFESLVFVDVWRFSACSLAAAQCQAGSGVTWIMGSWLKIDGDWTSFEVPHLVHGATKWSGKENAHMQNSCESTSTHGLFFPKMGMVIHPLIGVRNPQWWWHYHTILYPTIIIYIPCCDHGTCGDGEPISSFIQFSWSPPFGSWMTIRRNLNWHKIEDWNRKIVAIISNHAWGIIQSLVSECNKFGLGLAIGRCIDFLGAETYVLSIRPQVVSQRQNLAFDVCPGSRLKSNWTLEQFSKSMSFSFDWWFEIVFFLPSLKKWDDAPQCLHKFCGPKVNPQPDWCRRKSLNHQGQSWWSQWPWRLPAAPGLQAGTIWDHLQEDILSKEPSNHLSLTSTQSDPSRADYATLDPEFLAWSHAAHQADAIPGQWHAEWGWLWG